MCVCIYNEKKKRVADVRVCNEAQEETVQLEPAKLSPSLSQPTVAPSKKIMVTSVSLFLFGSKRVLSANTWCWTTVFVSVFSFLFFCCYFKYIFIFFFLKRKKERKKFSFCVLTNEPHSIKHRSQRRSPCGLHCFFGRRPKSGVSS